METTNTNNIHRYNFENIEKKHRNSSSFSLLHYAFMYRNFDKVLEIVNEDNLNEQLICEGKAGYEWITPAICAKWNENYIRAYDDKHNKNLYGLLKESESFEKVKDQRFLLEYTETVQENSTVFDIFFDGNQPVLDVKYYGQQELASKQVKKNGMSLVIDEVGTGKTVTALYSIVNTIQNAINQNEYAYILVVCPYNKRTDWQDDIRRQLGRYAHIVEQSDHGRIYHNHLKDAFFRENEHVIMITGQAQSKKDKEGTNSALKGSLEQVSLSENDDIERWDLVVIDEGHISFGNYRSLRSDQVMMLTATPIVVKSSSARGFEDYIELMNTITEKWNHNLVMNPIENTNPTEDDIFVGLFREDLGLRAAERIIRFEYCKRVEKRHELFYRIVEQSGFLAALQYDQDDTYLLRKARDNFGDDSFDSHCNYKLDKLLEIVTQNNNTNSYIIFCEHTEVVKNVYDRLTDEVNAIIAMKHGSHQEAVGMEDSGKEQFINGIKLNLRQKNRVIFVTTGKTGGTGLNLGEFDGIIHYELPFTSIELEQRFGRVDRMDTNNRKEKEMIFLLNESSSIHDFENNRMLYYCTTKIDFTCQYTPIRNTVLFYPEFIKRSFENFKSYLINLKENTLLNNYNEAIYNDVTARRRTISRRNEWTAILGATQSESGNKKIHEKIINVLNSPMDERIADEDFFKLLREYHGVYEQSPYSIPEYEAEKRNFDENIKIIQNVLVVIGKVSARDRDVFVALQESEEDGEHTDSSSKYQSLEKREKEDADRESHVLIESKINQLISLIENLNEDTLIADGIFYYNKDKRIERREVRDFRGYNSSRD